MPWEGVKVRTDKERLEKPSEALPRRSKVSFCASYVEQAQLRRGPAFSEAACAEIYANEIWQRQQLDDASWRATTEPLIMQPSRRYLQRQSSPHIKSEHQHLFPVSGLPAALGKERR